MSDLITAEMLQKADCYGKGTWLDSVVASLNAQVQPRVDELALAAEGLSDAIGLDDDFVMAAHAELEAALAIYRGEE